MLREAVLTGHSDSETPEPVEKPLCTKHHSTFGRACVKVAPGPGCAAGSPTAIAHTGSQEAFREVLLILTMKTLNFSLLL